MSHFFGKAGKAIPSYITVHKNTVKNNNNLNVGCVSLFCDDLVNDFLSMFPSLQSCKAILSNAWCYDYMINTNKSNGSFGYAS